jgi:hypothetical protein
MPMPISTIPASSVSNGMSREFNTPTRCPGVSQPSGLDPQNHYAGKP